MRSIFIGFCFLLTSVCFSEEEKAAEEQPEVPLSDEAADWLESYHINPTPEKFVGYMKQWAKEGTLQNHDAQPALIGFTSQLMRQNRDKIVVWAEELNGLDPKDLVVFNTALVFSRTGEADDLIKEALGERYKEFERPSKILELSLAELPTIDLLWGYFYATGSDKAIRKIVEAFRYETAPDKPEGVDVPEGYQPYYKILPGLAFSSLSHNIAKHPKVFEICEKIYHEGEMVTSMEKRNLHDLLSLEKPEKYEPRKEVKDSGGE